MNYGKRIPILLFCVLSILVIVLGVSMSDGRASEDGAESVEHVPLQPIEVGSPERIEIYPTEVLLDAARRRMHLIVTGHYADGRTADLTRASQFASNNPGVADVSDGLVIPTANGEAEINVMVGSLQRGVPVEVTGFDQPDLVSFNHETLAVFTRHGCNAGKCHGAPMGKAKFRLSMLAFDPDRDAMTLTREVFARRTNVMDPESSLLLRKPLMKVAHGGGKRLRKSDLGYEVLKGWIAEGCRADDREETYVTRLQIYPESGRVIQFPAHTQQLLVLAHFNDGSVRDVTRLCAFSGSDDTVASVRDDGLVVAGRRGQFAAIVRYVQQVESVALTFVRNVEGFAWEQPLENNYIDRLVHAKLKQMKYLPSELCRDDEFIRRVSLDVTGRLPSVEMVDEFLADASPDKRSRLIDELLESSDYAHFWALKWADLLGVQRNALGAQGVHKFYKWLVGSVEKNQPLDEFCRQLLTAKGSTYQNPPANYFVAFTEKSRPNMTESTAQIFMGVRIDCAKCHNHPFSHWTQENYLGLSTFFHRLKQKGGRQGDEKVVWVDRRGEISAPQGTLLKWSVRNKITPWVPGDGPMELVGEQDRRLAFVDWLTRTDNPFFAQVGVNRIWAAVMGMGIVDPVDDFRDSNPPSNPELLHALAADLVESGFDRKHILRVILNSRTYQRSAETSSFNVEDTKNFSHAQVRMLSAEQLLDAICDVTEMPETFSGLPAGTPATQLPSPDWGNSFLAAFGQPQRKTACACERGSDTNLLQALQLSNGDLVHGKLRSDRNRLHRLVSEGRSDDQIVREIYLASYGRPPTDAEVQLAADHLAASGEDRMEALQNVCWALINTNEFVFQH